MFKEKIFKTNLPLSVHQNQMDIKMRRIEL